MTNLVPGRDREVSVTALPGPLTPARLRAAFVGREAYRRTRYLVVRDGDACAVARVDRADERSLFAPITALEVLAGPDDCAVVDAPTVDTAVPSALAAAARQAPEARCVVVNGRYGHTSFICDPAPVRVRIADAVPPEPPKLADQVHRVLQVAEDLPPVEPVVHLIDLRERAATAPGRSYLFPCRAGGLDLPHADVAFLDERPPRRDWTLVGCTRSEELHRWCYGGAPTQVVDTCPARLAGSDVLPTLTKCCLLERGVQVGEGVVTVPWGATLEEVREALQAITRVMEPTWAPG